MKIINKKDLKHEEKVLVLKTCDKDLKCPFSGIEWPEFGYIESKDWDPNPCVYGDNDLHGLLWGSGDGRYLHMTPGYNWLVVEVLKKHIIRLQGDWEEHVKFPKGKVIYCGYRHKAVEIIHQNAPSGIGVACVRIAVGDSETAATGIYGFASAGNWGGKATAVGYYGTAIVGNYGTAIASGDSGTATAGYCGTAIVGNFGIATAGENGIASAGKQGVIQILYLDKKNTRERVKIGYIGENGLKPNVLYRLDKNEYLQSFSRIIFNFNNCYSKYDSE